MEKFPIRGLLLLSSATAALVLAGCTSPPKADNAPGDDSLYVHVQASREGVRVETNNVYAGTAPFVFRLLGDKDGTFHDFGDPQYVVRAVRASTNAPAAEQVFKTGNKSSPGDRIPGLIFLDMENPTGSFSVDTFPDK